jgi:O-antigen ligase
LLGKRFHHFIYLLSLALLVIGLSTSEFLMSVASIMLAANWLFEAGFKAKFARLKENKIAVILTFLFFIYVIWMAGTSNIDEGLKELRIRLPLLLFPIVLGSIPRFSESVLAWVARVFVAGTLVSTLISLGVYVEVIPTKADLIDVRNISIFISHIRLSLLICVAMIISIYFIVKRKEHRIIYSLIILWFVAFLYLIQSATGFIILFALLGFVALYSLKELKTKALKYGVFILATGVFSMGLIYVWNAKENYYKVSEVMCNSPLVSTQQGEPYFHDLNNIQLENNNYIWRNIHFESMRAAWNEVSPMKVSGEDRKGQPIEATLIRYLTSKGVCKDRDGVEGLTPLDINEIESGNASAVAPKMGLQKRLNEIFWEFDAYANGSNPSGNSVVMRLEFWKTAKAVIGENFLFGVGTGDGKQEMQIMYEKTNSVLNTEWRLGSHNEFLSTWVKTGMVGFLIFMIAFLYPLSQKKNWNFIYISFFLIAGISFLAENTLETQPGVTFFGFFNCWLLFQGISRKKASKVSDKI